MLNIMANQGGKRAGSGRKKHIPPLKARCINLTDEQAKLLRLWGRGDMGAGVRWLIDAAKLLVRRVEQAQPDSDDRLGTS
jgi:hypothetical protein